MLRIGIAVTALLVGAGGALAQDDLTPGKQLFEEKCASCHAVGDDGAKRGPSLNNLIGRPVADVEGFKYSDAMVEAGQAGLVWDVETLSKFLLKPRSVVNGSNMAFTGFRDNVEDVANLIAYLASHSSPLGQ